MTEAEKFARHKARLALIYAPFPRVRVLPRSYSWAGVLIEDVLTATGALRTPAGRWGADGYDATDLSDLSVTGGDR